MIKDANNYLETIKEGDLIYTNGDYRGITTEFAAKVLKIDKDYGFIWLSRLDKAHGGAEAYTWKISIFKHAFYNRLKIVKIDGQEACLCDKCGIRLAVGKSILGQQLCKYCLTGHTKCQLCNKYASTAALHQITLAKDTTLTSSPFEMRKTVCLKCFREKGWDTCKLCERPHLRNPDHPMICKPCYDNLHNCASCQQPLIMQESDLHMYTVSETNLKTGASKKVSYCPTCFAKKYYMCSNCGSKFPHKVGEVDNFVTTIRGKQVCLDCSARSFRKCSFCNMFDITNRLKLFETGKYACCRCSTTPSSPAFITNPNLTSLKTNEHYDKFFKTIKVISKEKTPKPLIVQVELATLKAKLIKALEPNIPLVIKADGQLKNEASVRNPNIMIPSELFLQIQELCFHHLPNFTGYFTTASIPWVTVKGADYPQIIFPLAYLKKNFKPWITIINKLGENLLSQES